MTTADNKAVFRRFYEETWNTGDVGILDKVLAPDFINHEIADGDVSHRELYKRAVIETHLGLPDFALAIDDLIAEGDMVVGRWHWRGTHTGAEPWGEPTGRETTATGITIVRIMDGKITDFWKKDAVSGAPSAVVNPVVDE
jgi:predicted ester cyclase